MRSAALARFPSLWARLMLAVLALEAVEPVVELLVLLTMLALLLLAPLTPLVLALLWPLRFQLSLVLLAR